MRACEHLFESELFDCTFLHTVSCFEPLLIEMCMSKAKVLCGLWGRIWEGAPNPFPVWESGGFPPEIFVNNVQICRFWCILSRAWY